MNSLEWLYSFHVFLVYNGIYIENDVVLFIITTNLMLKLRVFYSVAGYQGFR